MASAPQQRSGKATAAAAQAPAAPGQDAGEPPKARLRGAIHHYAAFVAVAVGIMLILEAQTPRARLGCIIYTIRWVWVVTTAGRGRGLPSLPFFYCHASWLPT